MKITTFFAGCLLAGLSVLPARGQERALQIFRDGSVIQSYTVTSIDSIKFGQVIAAPAAVNATIEGEAVRVSWSAVSGARSYQVFRSSDNTNYTRMAEGLTGTSWTDASPLRGQNYYKVKALGEQLESVLSDASAPVVFNDEGYSGNEIDIFSNLSYDEMVYVEGGTFLMGAQNSSSSWPNYDSSASSHEQSVHAVTLSSYYIGKYEVTQGLWEYVMSYSGKAADGSQLSPVEPYLGSDKPSSSRGVGSNYPVYYVSYDDIVNYFIPRLNKITGKKFRLPTEAEWEYAARGGQKDEYTRTHTSPIQNSGSGTYYKYAGSDTYYKYAGSDTIGDVAWYYSNSGSKTHPVGNKSPNALGIYDMSGNVWEWCSDWYSSGFSNAPQTNPQGSATGSYRVVRGGSWYFDAQNCRVSNRRSNTPDNRNDHRGLRLALCL